MWITPKVDFGPLLLFAATVLALAGNALLALCALLVAALAERYRRRALRVAAWAGILVQFWVLAAAALLLADPPLSDPGIRRLLWWWWAGLVAAGVALVAWQGRRPA